MITRAYQNAKGERQEISLFVEEWEALTEEGLQKLLGFASEPEAEKFEPVPVRPAVKKKRR